MCRVVIGTQGAVAFVALALPETFDVCLGTEVPCGYCRGPKKGLDNYPNTGEPDAQQNGK